MQKERKFMVVVLGPGHGTGMDVIVQPDKIVSYSGNLETVHVGTPRFTGTTEQKH